MNLSDNSIKYSYLLVLKFGSDTRPVSPDSDSVRTKAELRFDFDILLFFGRKKGRTYVKESDLGGIQTRDLRNRNPAFYSAELRGLSVCKFKNKK